MRACEGGEFALGLHACLLKYLFSLASCSCLERVAKLNFVCARGTELLDCAAYNYFFAASCCNRVSDAVTVYFLLFYLQDMIEPPYTLGGITVADSAEAAMTVFFFIQVRQFPRGKQARSGAESRTWICVRIMTRDTRYSAERRAMQGAR